jgi:hypothetical protein
MEVNSADSTELRSKNRFTEIATIIGGDVSSDRVEHVVSEAIKQQLFFHGSKGQHKNSISVNGVQPNSGGKSFWTTGEKLFIGQVLPSGKIQTQTSTFFDYAAELLIVTDLSQVNSNISSAIQFPPHSVQTFGYTIPSDAISYLYLERVGNMDDSSIEDLSEQERFALYRQRGQKREQAMFRLIEKVIGEGFKPGKEYPGEYIYIPDLSRVTNR